MRSPRERAYSKPCNTLKSLHDALEVAHNEGNLINKTTSNHGQALKKLQFPFQKAVQPTRTYMSMSSLGLVSAVDFITGLKYVSAFSRVHVKYFITKFGERSKYMSTAVTSPSSVPSGVIFITLLYLAKAAQGKESPATLDSFLLSLPETTPQQGSKESRLFLLSFFSRPKQFPSHS
jgi:hypothetical protein